MPLLLFGSLGIMEVVVIMTLALLLFGPKKLPEIGKSLGKGLREFKKGTSGFMDAVNLETPPQPPPQQAQTPAPKQVEAPAVSHPAPSESIPAGGTPQAKPQVEDVEEVVIDFENKDTESK